MRLSRCVAILGTPLMQRRAATRVYTAAMRPLASTFSEPWFNTSIQRCFSTQTAGFLMLERGSNGSFVLRTPLPSVPGISSLVVDKEGTVADLKAAVCGKDSSVKQVIALDDHGERLAMSTRINDVAREPWTLIIDNIRMEGQALAQIDGEVLPNRLRLGYQKLRSSIMKQQASTVSWSEYLALVRQALSHSVPEKGSDQAVFNSTKLEEAARRWIDYLQVEGLALHFGESVDEELRNTVFLQPEKLSSVLVHALDMEGDRIKAELMKKENELHERRSLLLSMEDIAASITKRAISSLRLRAYLIGGAAIAQWAYIFNLVYEISWDFMEPVTYFITAGYGIVFYFFFMVSRMDPTATNIFHYFLLRKREAMHKQLEQPEWRSLKSFKLAKEEVLSRIAKLEGDIHQLEARLKPPTLARKMEPLHETLE